MLTKTEHWFVELHWANTHTLTNSQEVVDYTYISGLWKMRELEDWIRSLYTQAIAWNLSTQIFQVLALLHEMRGASEDFMDEVRKSNGMTNAHPMGNSKITVNRKADSRVTTIDFDVIVANKKVQVMFVLSQKADVLMVTPDPVPYSTVHFPVPLS